MVETSSLPTPTQGQIAVTVVTPEGSAFDGLAEIVVVPAHDGEIAFQPGHAPLVGAIGVGEMRIRVAGENAPRRWYLEGGVVQVLDGVVTVLAERVTPASDVDAAEAKEALAAAQAEVPTRDEAFAARDHAEAAARARIRVAEGGSA